MPEVEYPDGTVVEFPDGTPDLTMQAISSRFYDNNSQVFNYNPQPFEHGMFINPLEGVPEAFAKGVYEAPGQLAAIYDQFSPWATFTQAITGKSLQQSFDDVTGNSALPYNPDDYGASKLVQSIARLSGNVVGDPLNAAPIGMVGKAGVRQGADNLMRPNTLNKQAGVVGIDDLPMDEASRMQRARDMGFDTDVYHGTTHDIKQFDATGANPESDWGAATYTSNSIDDINPNYAGVGPDLTGRIQTESERVANELMDFPDEVLDEYGYTLKQYEADEAGIAEEIAKKRLIGSADQGVVYPLKINTDKYAVIGGDKSTRMVDSDYYEEARSYIDIEDYTDEIDFADAVSERAMELKSEDPESLYNRVYEALRDTDAYQHEQQLDDVMEEIQESLIDGDLDIDDLDDAIRSNITEAYDESTGDMVSAGGISAQTLKNLGYEGVIDNKVDLKFGSGRKYGQQMEGVYNDTQHVITFPSYEKNLRSINAKFDPAKKNSSNLLAGGAGAGTYMVEEKKKRNIK